MKTKIPTRIFDGMYVFQTTSKSRAPREYILFAGQRCYLHTYLAENYIRPLTRDEVVHHKDGNPLNNELSNLEIMTRASHASHHKPVTGYKFTEEQKKRLSKAHIGQVAWNKGEKGFKHTEQSKQNMSKAQKGRKITWGDKITIAKTKVTKEQLIQYLSSSPQATLAETMSAFGLKSHMPICKHGGLKKLKMEAK